MSNRNHRRAERTKSAARETGADEGLRFTRGTAVFGAVGVVLAGAGFYLLAAEAINVAPVLLLLAFLVFFPLALTR